MIGQTISHYRITEKLGEGGMGVVYKAEDTRLERTVAIKFLATHLLANEDSRKRFLREAKAAASLDHPNICTVHEIGEADGQTFLVMAHVAGRSVAEKIEQRPLKLDDALDIAIQTAQGLQAAHEKGMVHRDIKPANVMVSDKGHATIMDFGLARLSTHSHLTKEGATLGTAAYMPPEQLQGKPVDQRADIWSLGAVIYEMVTGQRAFHAEYEQAVAYTILNEEPEPITALRAGVPMELEWIVSKALAKAAEERYQQVEEVLVDLRMLKKKQASGKSTLPPLGTQRAALVPSDGDSITRVQHTAPLHPGSESVADLLTKYRVIEDLGLEGEGRIYHAEDTEEKRSVTIRVLPQSVAHRLELQQRRRQRLSTIIPVVSLALAAVFAALWLHQPEPQASLRKLTLHTGDNVSRPAISPDGRHIAYLAGTAGQRALRVHDLDQDEPRQIAGPGQLSAPFWSPDGVFLAFRSGTELKKIPMQGGTAVTLCTLPGQDVSSGAWSPDGGSIVFGGIRPWSLYEVPAQGGPPEVILDPPEGYPYLMYPHFLPLSDGSRQLLYAAHQTAETGRVVVRDLETGEQQELINGSQPVYASTGELIYQSLNPRGVWALPFSVETLGAAGESFPIREFASDPSVAADGTLVYLASGDAGMQQLVWRDRAGKRVGTIGQPQAGIQSPALSLDGTRVAVRGFENENWDIWIHDATRGSKTRLTFHPAAEDNPTWLPSGEAISFSSSRNGNMDLFLKSANGRGEAEVLRATEGNEYGFQWSRDGMHLLFDQVHPDRFMDLYYLRRQPEGGGYERLPIAETPYDELSAHLSPDGRLVAYESNESGRYEVYIQPFPEGEGRWQVSSRGGSQPRWSGAGNEIFYVLDGTIMAVTVRTSPRVSAG